MKLALLPCRKHKPEDGLTCFKIRDADTLEEVSPKAIMAVIEELTTRAEKAEAELDEFKKQASRIAEFLAPHTDGVDYLPMWQQVIGIVSCYLSQKQEAEAELAKLFNDPGTFHSAALRLLSPVCRDHLLGHDHIVRVRKLEDELDRLRQENDMLRSDVRGMLDTEQMLEAELAKREKALDESYDYCDKVTALTIFGHSFEEAHEMAAREMPAYAEWLRSRQ